MRVLLILLVFVPCFGFSQGVIYKRFSTNEGLPSTEVYAIAQGREGYIWVGTDNGLSRYDGKEFVTFSTKDVLPDNTVLDILISDSGKIWPVTLSDKLCYLQNNKFYNYNYTIEFDSSTNYNADHASYLGKDKNGYSYLGSQGSLFKETSPNSKAYVSIKKTSKSSTTPDVFFKLKYLENGDIAQRTSFEKTSNTSEFTIKNKDGLQEVHGPFVADNYLETISYYRFFKNSNDRVIGLNFQDGHYFTFNNKGSSNVKVGQVKINNIINYYEDNNSNIWFLTKNGAYCYLKGDLHSKPLKILENSFLTQVIQDLEGNYWFADNNNGVILINSINLLRFIAFSKEEERKVVQIRTDGDFLWYSTIAGELIRIDSNFRSKLLFKESLEPYDFYPFYAVDKSKVILPGLKVLRKKSIARTKNKVKLYAVTKDFEKWKDKLYVASSFGVIQVDENGIRIQDTYGDNATKQDEVYLRKRTNALLADGDSLWLGCLDGLYSMNSTGMQKRKVEYYGLKNELLSNRVMVLEKLKKGVILAGTKGAGIVLYDYLKGEVNNINIESGISSNFIKALFVFNGKIYIGTNKGLSIVSLHPDNSIQSVNNIDIQNGLPSNEVAAINYFRGKIWLGTSSGLLYFNPEELTPNYSSPPIFIKGIETSDSFYSYSRNIEKCVIERFRNVNITYNAIGYRAGNRIRYKCLLDGQNEDTIYTSNSEVRYTNLAPGDYIFSVWAKNEDGIWSSMPDTITFTIPKKFYETIWFILAIVLVIGLILSLLIKEYNRRKREKLKNDLQKSELKQKALAALMNPHFVYNSLSAIQNFINKGDNEKSNDYLTRFSKLIRMNLNSVRDGKIALEDEITRLELYLDIEKMRFGEKLSYKFELGEDLESSGIEIPSMVLQPFVENAIWHGVLPKKENGLVEICIGYFDNNILDVVIKDNGLGIDAVKKENKQHHTSLSMDITKERLELLSQQSGIDYAIEITSISEKGEGGTKVHLRIPIE